jgi:steroid delta-isomerase-like uncharacterized protein
MTGELEPLAADALAAAWLAAWSGTGGFDACCAPDVQYEDPLAVEPLRGPEALTAHAAGLREAFPDMRVERTGRSLTGGPYACIPWRMAGTHKAATTSLPATNRFVALHGMHYLELSDGQVRRARGFFDLYEAATQLGLLPSRGGLGEAALLLLRGFGLRSKG